MGPALAAAGIAGDGAPKAVAAGDGSESACQRIGSGQYQAVTVAEPLNLQRWQLVDELNRAVQGAAWSGFTSPLHVVTMANVGFDGGEKTSFNPGNGYREAYAKIWGKQARHADRNGVSLRPAASCGNPPMPHTARGWPANNGRARFWRVMRGLRVGRGAGPVLPVVLPPFAKGEHGTISRDRCGAEASE